MILVFQLVKNSSMDEEEKKSKARRDIWCESIDKNDDQYKKIHSMKPLLTAISYWVFEMRRDTIIEFNLESINLIYVDEIQYVYNNTAVWVKLWGARTKQMNKNKKYTHKSDTKLSRMKSQWLSSIASTRADVPALPFRIVFWFHSICFLLVFFAATLIQFVRVFASSPIASQNQRQ